MKLKQFEADDILGRYLIIWYRYFAADMWLTGRCLKCYWCMKRMRRSCTERPTTPQHAQLNEAISGNDHCIDEFYEKHVTVNSDHEKIRGAATQLMNNDVNHEIYNASLHQVVFVRYATWMEKEKGESADLKRDAFTEAIHLRLARDHGRRYRYLNYYIFECS